MTDWTPPDPILEAARLAGFKPEILRQVAGMKKLTVRVVDRVPLVQPEGPGAEEDLRDYAKRELADFLPALKRSPVQEYIAAKYHSKEK